MLLGAEELTLAEVPVTEPVFGAVIELDVPVGAGAAPPVLVRGRPARVRTAIEAEVFMTLDDGSQLLTSFLDLAVLTH